MQACLLSGQVCPEMGSSSEISESGEPARKKAKKEEKSTVSQFLTTMLFPKLLIMLSAITLLLI